MFSGAGVAGVAIEIFSLVGLAIPFLPSHMNVMQRFFGSAGSFFGDTLMISGN